jgi:hypothetical protein
VVPAMNRDGRLAAGLVAMPATVSHGGEP